MNASIRAARIPRKRRGPEPPDTAYSRYITSPVTTSKTTVTSRLREAASPTPSPRTSKAPNSKTTPSTGRAAINTDAARLSTCSPRSA